MSEKMNRVTGLLILEVVNSNPNGDPDCGGAPRMRMSSIGCGLGEISPVSFKRKLRDLIEMKTQVYTTLMERLHLEDGHYEILESRGRDTKLITKELKEAVDSNSDFTKSTFVKKYWDARLFGNTFLDFGDMNKKEGRKKEKEEKSNHSKTIKTGVAQFGMGISVKPVEIISHTNTNAAKEGSEKMAPLGYNVVAHAVYCMPFFINPTYADKSGCTTKDIELMKALIPYAYDHTRSAVRPDVRIRHAWYIEHKDALGSCPDYLLFDALTPKAKTENPASWDDYDVPADLPDELKKRTGSIVDLMQGY